MKIDSRIIPVFQDVAFVKRYKELVDRSSEKGMQVYDVNVVQGIFNQLGHSAQYNKSENFFKVLLKSHLVELQINISLKHGALELILGIIVDGERYKVGGPFGFIYRSLTRERIAKPIFSNYDELGLLIDNVLVLVEDIKSGLINIIKKPLNSIGTDLHVKSNLETKLEELILKLKGTGKPSYQYFEDVILDMKDSDKEGALKRLKSSFSITERANFTKEETDLLSEIISLIEV